MAELSPEGTVSLSDIEQAIKNAVTGLNRPYIAEVATYGGEFDEDLPDVVRRFPAVWVSFAGLRPRRLTTTRRKWAYAITFVVLVGARSIRSEQATRHGVTIGGELVEVGTFQLLRDVAAALLDQRLGLAIDPLAPGKVSTLFNTRLQGQAVSVLAQEWHTEIAVGADHDRDAPWLESLSMDYLLQPHDETTDANDVVPLDADQGFVMDGRRTLNGEAEMG